MKTRLVVCDTSPIRVLRHLVLLDLLGEFFGEVLIPPAVARELETPKQKSPPMELAAIPNGRVEAPKDGAAVRRLEGELQTGEAEAIVLARETGADLIIDERAGRLVAGRMGIRFTGVIGLLVRARQEHLVGEVVPLIERVRGEMNFFVSDEVLREIRRLAGE